MGETASQSESDTTGKSAWPKTMDDTIDWEAVFENPDIGLIALLSQAQSAHALRDISLAIVKQLYTRKNDPAEIKKFTSELQSLIPDEISNDLLPGLIDGVVAILHLIKDERIRKAAEFVEYKKKTKAEKIDHEKRDVSIRALRAQRRKIFLGVGVFGTVVALIAIIYTGYSVITTSRNEDNIQVFIKQMEAAVAGENSFEHTYSGMLRFENKFGHKAVTADNIPTEVCHQVASYFANQGNVIINEQNVIVNEQINMNVSEGRIAEYCNLKSSSTTLTWITRESFWAN